MRTGDAVWRCDVSLEYFARDGKGFTETSNERLIPNMLTKLGILLLLATCTAAQSSDADKKTTRKELTPERAIVAARKMRDQLNDPDSLKVASFLYYEPEPPDGHFLCVIFRAKNEHGGMVLQTFINNAVDTSRGGFNNETVWPIVCKGEVVLDATDAVKAALRADREKD